MIKEKNFLINFYKSKQRNKNKFIKNINYHNNYHFFHNFYIAYYNYLDCLDKA